MYMFTRSVVDEMRIVWPSGTALATVSPAMLPDAPERLSTTTDWPSTPRSPSARIRAVMSVLPPGAKGTSSRMGRDGQASAAYAGSAACSRRNRTAKPDEMTDFMLLLSSLGVFRDSTAATEHPAFFPSCPRRGGARSSQIGRAHV